MDLQPVVTRTNATIDKHRDVDVFISHFVVHWGEGSLVTVAHRTAFRERLSRPFERNARCALLDFKMDESEGSSLTSWNEASGNLFLSDP